MAMRRTGSASRAAAAGAAALGLLGGVAFVAPGGAAPQARGAAPQKPESRGLEMKGFQAAQAPSSAGRSAGADWASVLAVAAALGLAAGVATAPVRADDAADLEASLSGGVQGRTSSSKAKRGVLIKKGDEEKAKAAASGGSSTSASTILPDGRTFISPADELDEDELPLGRTNPFLFVVALGTGPLIYLVFWILGSTNVI
uniref:Uncharacterized protein n=1 Tax=Zooxanthella nutricula TaxID=1333877 RepID=A0A7S2IMW9_9DINO|mmetsp:Transcript_20025/g.59933  ORF Transcript_20025/g.59933 Transcript_20025/m.59933 type:complete len:201 (+) Transcript_20025:74-676(+)